MEVRTAHSDELSAVMGVLDGALLAVDATVVSKRIADDMVLVAVEGSRVLGACVLDGREIEAIAVRRMRRGQGIGSRLIEAAADSTDGDLTAEFDSRVQSFYESLGFVVEPADEPDRFRGRRSG